MPTVYKVLAQSTPTLNSNTTVYTVPAANSAVISTVSICNLTGVAGVLSLAAVPSGSTLANLHYFTRNQTIAAQDTLLLTLGITLAAGDTIVANAITTGSNIAVAVWGSEVY